jgi:hypothetical protein
MQIIDFTQDHGSVHLQKPFKTFQIISGTKWSAVGTVVEWRRFLENGRE